MAYNPLVYRHASVTMNIDRVRKRGTGAEREGDKSCREGAGCEGGVEYG